MADTEYRIVAKVDPQTAAGSNKVKQDLRGIQTEAKATEASLDKALAKPKAGAAAEITKVKDGLQEVNRTSQALNKSGGALSTTFGGILNSTKGVAAETLRLNTLLSNAKDMFAAGTLSAERYARVQDVVRAGLERTRLASAALNAAQAAGAPAAAVAPAVGGGAGVAGAEALARSLEKVAESAKAADGPLAGTADAVGGLATEAIGAADGFKDAGGKIGAFATFLAGPVGIAVGTFIPLLIEMGIEALNSGNEIETMVEQLKEDARQTELAARAKEVYARSMEGVTAAIREQNKELKENIATQRDALTSSAATARRNLDTFRQRQAEAKIELDAAKAALEEQSKRAANVSGTHFGDAARQAVERETQRVRDAQKAYDDLGKTVALAEENIRRADAALAQDAAKSAVDPIRRINEEYDQLIKNEIERSVAAKESATTLAAELTLMEKRREKALEAAEAEKKLNKQRSDGVAIFKSQRQALQIAGKELQGQGYKVNEGLDFGGITPGAHKSSHINAVDVNVGKGVTEANVPDLKAKFDAAARRYQARGYKVLWNGWVYSPGGNGPSYKIPAGQDQHHDHIHLEAPKTIVGKPTGASTESQFNREENQAEREAAAAARVEEQASDFVASVVNRAAQRGLPNNRAGQLQAAIDDAFEDFERRFNRAATAAEKLTIKTALTDANAREQAQHFEEAYNKPLERQIALAGKTGIEREILNAKLDETAKKGEALTAAEEKTIETSIRGNDALSRKAQILEQLRNPLENYRATLEALNGLLADGEINQTSYNARLAEMGAQAAGVTAGLPGVDPNTGMAYSDISAVADENARYAKELEDFETYRDQLLQMGINYDALELAAKQQHIQNLNDIEQARKDVQLQSAEEIWGSLSSIFADGLGKQSALYKAAFATEKAVAIARSIVAISTGIAQASALPFPANLGAMATVAAQTASIVANIRAVTLAFKDGGEVRGPGGPRSDSINARLSNGEFVVNAQATANNKPLLEAINAGQDVTAQRKQTAAAGAAAVSAATAPTMVGATPVEIKQRIVNVLDPAIVGDWMQSPEGEEQWVNMMQRNGDTLRSIASGQ